MLKIQKEPLTHEAFAPFGEYTDLLHPQGHALCGELHSFYPDRLLQFSASVTGFSPITVRRPERYIVDTVEYHTTTAEVILPLDGDMILHVAQPSGGEPIPQKTRAFEVPRGTMVRINAGVWHLCPLPTDAPLLTCMIALPQCTYANDCKVVSLSPEQQFEII